MKKILIEVSKFCIYLSIATLSIYVYIKISNYYQVLGNMNFQDMKKIEILILLFLFLLIYFPSKKRYFRVFFILIVSFLLCLILFDSFYFFLTRSPQVSDFSNIFVIMKFDPLMSFMLFSVILLIIFGIFYCIRIMYKEYGRKIFILFILFKLFVIVGLAYFITKGNMEEYLKDNFEYIHWSQTKTIQKNGRLSSFFYYSYMSFKAQKELEKYKNNPIDVNKILFQDEKIHYRKNIYIVVLESFIDPRLLENITFDKSPIHPNLKKYLYNKNFSHIISPVYGGDTAQAEFEILTGIKTYQKINSIEFNILEGKQISGFINHLKNNDYNSIVISAANAGYFNAKTAYKSIGFDKIIFMDEEKNYKGNKNIFDNDLYSYSLDYLKNNSLEKPYILYQIGMFGHHPYRRNYKERPNIININSTNKKIFDISNQIYYRTKALSFFLDKLIQYDKDSIILVSSDHLPPILSKKVKYSLSSKYTNIAFLLVNGEPVDISGAYQYEFPHLILEYLYTDRVNFHINNQIMLDIYFKVLSESR